MTPPMTSSAHVSITSLSSSIEQDVPPKQPEDDKLDTLQDISEEARSSESLDHSNVSREPSEQGFMPITRRLSMFRKSFDRSKRIGGEYKIVRKIDEGSYGIVYKVVDREGRMYAAKIAKSPTLGFSIRKEQMLLPPAGRMKLEGQVYSYYKGRHIACRVVVMDLLGRSVKKQFLRYGPLSVHSVLLFGVQATSRIEELHKLGYVHCDVKPSNFATGLKEDSGTIYMIDLGLAERYRSSRSRRHVKRKKGYQFTGSKDFAPRASHRGETQSRRCDLESLVYTMVFLREGSLRWSSRSMETAGRMKEEISASLLCGTLPSEVGDYYRAVRNLSFDERPNYSKLRDLLVCAMEKRGLDVHGTFPWQG